MASWPGPRCTDCGRGTSRSCTRRSAARSRAMASAADSPPPRSTTHALAGSPSRPDAPSSPRTSSATRRTQIWCDPAGVEPAARAAATAADRPPLQGCPWPGRTRAASMPSSRVSDAIACARSAVRRRCAVRSRRQHIQGRDGVPTNSRAVACQVQRRAARGVARDVDDPRCARHVERRSVSEGHDLLDGRDPEHAVRAPYSRKAKQRPNPDLAPVLAALDLTTGEGCVQLVDTDGHASLGADALREADVVRVAMGQTTARTSSRLRPMTPSSPGRSDHWRCAPHR